MDKILVRNFYDSEAKERKFLHGYEEYVPRQIRKMTHLEEFSQNVLNTGNPGRQILLFDYRDRDVRTGQAAVFDVTDAYFGND